MLKKGVIRKIIPLLILVIILLTFMPAPASATVTVTIGDGDIFSEVNITVPLLIKDVEDVAAATIKVSYDPSVIVITAVGNSDFENFVPNLWYADDGWVKMTGYNIVEGLSGDVKFAELTISPVGNHGDSTDLRLEMELSDSAGVPVEAEVVNCSFHIGKESDFQPSPEPSPTPSVNEPTVPASSSSSSSSTRSSPSPTPTSVHETVRPAPLPPPSPQPGESGIITVQVGNVTAESGEIVNITIMIRGVGGAGLSSALINLTYDPEIVEVVSAGNSDFDMFMSNIVDGKVRMVGFQTGAEGLKGDIKFAELRVKAVGKANESSELELEVKELTDNEGFPAHFEVEDGWFSIKGGEKTEPEQSKPIIPAAGVVETIAVIAGFIVIRLRRK